MKTYAETKRLVLREMVQSDEDKLFEPGSDPDVLKYLNKKPVKDIEQLN